MFDAFRQNLEVARRDTNVLSRLGLSPHAYQLLTVHRAENTDQPDRLAAILLGVAASGVRTVFPAHPRTLAVLKRRSDRLPANLQVIDPVGYLEMLVLEDSAELIATDSGGVQKEAYFAGRPCITLRRTTEWTETVAAGWNKLVDADAQAIAVAMKTFRPSGERPDLFGDGHAAEHVVQAIT